MAHPHPGARHEEVEGGGVRVRVGGDARRRGEAVAGGDPARGGEQEADPRPRRLRDGEVQVPEGLHHLLRLRRPPRREPRVPLCRRSPLHSAIGGGAQGFHRPHGDARLAGAEEYQLRAAARRRALSYSTICCC